jgi:subtilisin family serine protease
MDMATHSAVPRPFRVTVRGPRIVLLALVAACLPVRRADAAADLDQLMARASERGSVRVLARLDVPAAPQQLAGAARVDAQLQAIRSSRTAVARDLDGTAWRMARSFDTIPYIALEASPAALAALARSGAVLAIDEDRLEKVLLPDSVPQIHADEAWAAGYEGSGWTVAILDTGVHGAHPFLAGKVVSEACYSANGSCPNGQSEQIGPGAGESCSYAPRSCLHGTHVAGIAAGRGSDFSGVARGADIIALQVFSRLTGADCKDDVEDPCAKSFTSDTIAALERVYALRDTYRIAAVNMSLGGGSFTSQSSCDLADAARKAAVDNLRAVGIATVAAAGNASSSNALSAPACISSVISVGAVDGSDAVTKFSNSAPFLTLFAPGLSILSSVPPDGFERISGTSQAAPHVAGAFAILSERLGRGDVDTVLAALEQTGVPVRVARSGVVKPRIDVFAALNALPAPASSSGLQIVPDGSGRTLISKDVNGERWAITRNPDDGTVTGNVFLPAGGAPQFVWCQQTGDDGDPDPYTVQIDFACSGADACAASSCPASNWSALGQVTLPGSFFLPPRSETTSAASVASATAVPAGTSASGLQITPDQKRTLISKDVASERWAITQNPDGSVTGNVFSATGGDPKFVSCTRTGDDGNPDPDAVQISFACSAADRCAADPCTPDEWTLIGTVTLPGSFFRP